MAVRALKIRTVSWRAESQTTNRRSTECPTMISRFGIVVAPVGALFGRGSVGDSDPAHAADLIIEVFRVVANDMDGGNTAHVALRRLSEFEYLDALWRSPRPRCSKRAPP